MSVVNMEWFLSEPDSADMIEDWMRRKYLNPDELELVAALLAFADDTEAPRDPRYPPSMYYTAN